MKCGTHELRAIANRLIDHLEATGHQNFELSHEYYWSVPANAKYVPYAPPGDLSLGQLSDDLAELRRIANGETEPVSYALVWLGAVLSAVGEQIVA